MYFELIRIVIARKSDPGAWSALFQQEGGSRISKSLSSYRSALPGFMKSNIISLETGEDQ